MVPPREGTHNIAAQIDDTETTDVGDSGLQHNTSALGHKRPKTQNTNTDCRRDAASGIADVVRQTIESVDKWWHVVERGERHERGQTTDD